MADWYFINSGNTSDVNNWSLFSGGPGGFGPPESGDTVYFDVNSGPAEVDVILNLRSIDFTGYESEIKMTKEIVLIGDGQLNGGSQFITLSSGMSFFVDSQNIEGKGSIKIVGATGEDFTNIFNVTSNGKKFPNALVFGAAGNSPLFNLQDDFTVGGVEVVSSGTFAGSILGGSGKLSIEGSLSLGGTSFLSGGEIVFVGEGSVTTSPTATLSSALTINAPGNTVNDPGKTIIFSGTINYNGSALTYIAGNVVTTGSTLLIGANSCTLNTNIMSWNNVTVNSNGTLTISSTLRGIGTFTSSATKTYIANGTITFASMSITGSATFSGNAGTVGFNVANLILNTAGSTLTLKDGVTYEVSGLFTANTGTPASPIAIASSHATNKALFKVTGTQAANTNVNATRLDSSGGITLITSGTLTQTTNWNNNATNTEDMDYNVKGKVTSSSEEYFNCLDTPNLRVRVYKVLFGSTEELTTAGSYVTVATNGTFNYNVPTNVNSFLIKLFLLDNGVEVLAAQSEKLCHHDDTNITFKIDENMLGRPVWDKIKTRLQTAGLTSLPSIAGLSSDQLTELSCLTCVSYGTLVRFQKAYALWDSFIVYSYSPVVDAYTEGQTLWTAFKADTENGRTIFFALLKFLNTSLQQVFGFSRTHFSELLQNTINKNEIASSLLNDTNLNRLEGSRNIILLNSKEDNEFNDAKLIHLSGTAGVGNNYADKNELLNNAFQSGGLESYISDVVGENTTAGDRMIPIVKINRNFEKHFSHVKAFINSKGTSPNYFDIIKAGPAAWNNIFSSASGFPEGYNNKDEFTQAVYNKVAETEPTARTIYGLTTSALPTNYTDLGVVLDRSINRTFNIHEHSVASHFKIVQSPNPSNYDEITPSQATSLQTLQRSIKLSGDQDNLQFTKLLINNELSSARSIVMHGREPFVNIATSGGVSEAKARATYNASESINATVKMLALNYNKYDSKTALMPLFLKPPQTIGDAIPKDMPNMEGIFGSFNTCECCECQSVYSPAAYLTDLLQWLRTSVTSSVSGSPTGLGALKKIYIAGSPSYTFDRRPDITHIYLNCSNTETLIPYIDIVNEILCFNLMGDLTPSISPVFENFVQTTKTADELLLEPQNENAVEFEKSEDHLKNFNYPWVLPYDRAFDKTITYSEKLGKTYHELISDFSKPIGKFNTINWANAYLRLNEKESNLLTTDHHIAPYLSTFWPTFWGIAAAPTSNKIGQILTGASLNSKELEDILLAYYIRTAGAIKLVEGSDVCDIESYTFSTTFTPEIADRFMRFLRLKNKTGLSTSELDLALKNFSTLPAVPTINTSSLIKLAAAKAFCNEHLISFNDFQVWFNNNAYHDPFTPANYSPYYTTKFQNAKLPQKVKDFFNPANTGSNYTTVTSVTAFSSEQKHILASIFNVSVTDIENIVTLSGITGAFDSVKLSVIDRYSSLIRTFGIAKEDVIDVFSLIGNPFQSAIEPKDFHIYATKFKEFKQLKTSASKLIDLVKGLNYYALNGSNVAVNVSFDEEVKKVWLKIEKAFQETIKANAVSKPFSAISPFLPSAGDKPFYVDGIIKNLALHFGFITEDTESIADIKSIITYYSGIWLDDFIKQDGSTRDWATKRGMFTPLYRILNRIAKLMELFGLDKTGLSSAVSKEISGTLNIPRNPFYWLGNDFTTLNIDDFIWIKSITNQAALLGLSQGVYYSRISDFLAKFSPNTHYTSGSSQGIADFYAEIPAGNTYRHSSYYEFMQTLLKSREIANTTSTNDFVLVMNSFIKITDVAKELKITATECWSWVWQGAASPTAVDRVLSKDILRVLKSRFETFSELSKFLVPTQDDLRMRLRDALVGYYIGQKKFTDTRALYDFYLLDTEMSPCMQTTRIVAATSSVQLMIHRGLLGLERNLEIGDTANKPNKKEWEWRKNYRVWEANRKVFLYPENWLEPSLRPRKSPFFKEAEDLLLQDEINQKNTEAAFGGYLTQLNEVAHLDVRAVYIEGASVGVYSKKADEVIHVFARTWNAPYTNYHRIFSRNAWSAWEKIEVEIESNHIIPTFFNRKLYLFFPLFIEKQKMVNNVGHPYFEVQMCYTKYDFGKWSPKKVLNAKLYAGKVAFQVHPSNENTIEERLFGGWQGGSNYGNDVFSNYGNYSLVSLKKEDFFFHTDGQNANGDLIISVRRALDPAQRTHPNTYTEYAYDFGFKISACDEKTELIPPTVTEPYNSTLRGLTRPYMTLPFGQQDKSGKDISPLVFGDDAFFVKTGYNFAASVGGSNVALLTSAPVLFNYILTYPHQFRGAHVRQLPFFYYNGVNSFFINYNSAKGKNQFYNNSHPYACTMLGALNQYGIEGLLNSPLHTDLNRQLKEDDFFVTNYNPNTNAVLAPYPKDEFDFGRQGPYGLYNWEVFFHSVSLISRKLRGNNKYAEAIKWLSYIFDPNNKDVDNLILPDPELRYWKIKPFMKDVSNDSIQNLMRLLSSNNLNATDVERRKQIVEQIVEWRHNPFDPFLIADMRTRAYMLWTVMEFIQILTDWGDYLFRQDTMESVTEATNLYIVASEILGQRPKKVKRPKPNPKTFENIQAGLDPFSNTAIAVENYLVTINHDQSSTAELYDTGNYSGEAFTSGDSPLSNSYAVNTLPELYFCIPDNPKLIELWDKVDDRLFKIRHCMNIDGKKRTLALFSPPIDPAMLVQAAAAGLSISDALADMSAPLPHYRFSYLLQKANEFCSEVKSLGSQLLTLLEKKDAEELALFRQVHEQNILKTSRALKQMAIEEAKQNYATLQSSKNLIQIRYDDYNAREKVNSREENAQRQTRISEGLMYNAEGVKILASILHLIPDVHAGQNNFAKLPGGDKIGAVLQAGAGALELVASVTRNKASMSLTYAGYDRRVEDWNLQKKTALEELAQVDRQLIASEIRIKVTEKELQNHDIQVAQSEEMYEWLKNKYTNKKLYTWMASQVKTVYRQMFDLAYGMAKTAQAAYDYELGKDGSNIVKYGQWDSANAGLLAGERLSLQLKTLESEYIKNNAREYEMSKNISLSLLNPSALEDLILNGTCSFLLPELLFDMDQPGQYFRRIKSVSISIPCISGANTNVNAMLTLNNHSIRKAPGLSGTNYVTSSGFGESIATSSAQNDSGVFELNFKDERYVPFEGKGAISEWTLDLTQIDRTNTSKETIRQFDFNTISDVVVHVKYTSKYDGAFKGTVKTNIDSTINSMAASINGGKGILYSFSLRHDMPNEWNAFKQSGSTDIIIDKKRLPYFVQAMTPVIGDVTLFVDTSLALPPATNKDIKVKANPSASLTTRTLTLVPDTRAYTKDLVAPAISFGSILKIAEENAGGNALNKADIQDIVIIAKIDVS